MRWSRDCRLGIDAWKTNRITGFPADENLQENKATSARVCSQAFVRRRPPDPPVA
jgi:hypothetical protein